MGWGRARGSLKERENGKFEKTGFPSIQPHPQRIKQHNQRKRRDEKLPDSLQKKEKKGQKGGIKKGGGPGGWGGKGSRGVIILEQLRFRVLTSLPGLKNPIRHLPSIISWYSSISGLVPPLQGTPRKD